MCGEKFPHGRRHKGRKGSPPHVRGKVNLRTALKLVGGITPACAGKSMPTVMSDFRYRDHPRMCGEKAAVVA